MCTLSICLQAILGPSPQVLSELLSSAWAGWESQPAGAYKEATAACFQDLLVWGLTKVRPVSRMSWRGAWPR